MVEGRRRGMKRCGKCSKCGHHLKHVLLERENDDLFIGTIDITLKLFLCNTLPLVDQSFHANRCHISFKIAIGKTLGWSINCPLGLFGYKFDSILKLLLTWSWNINGPLF